MASIYDVDPTELIEKAALELEKIPDLKEPEWVPFVKTGVHKERPPVNKNWWYVRLAAILRSVYILGPIGTQGIRRKYGGRKNRGMEPEKTFKGSGSIARKALQKLEKAGLIKFTEKGLHKGRIITPKGKSLLDKIANEIKKSKPKIEIHSEKPAQINEQKTAQSKQQQTTHVNQEQRSEKPAAVKEITAISKKETK